MSHNCHGDSCHEEKHSGGQHHHCSCCCSHSHGQCHEGDEKFKDFAHQLIDIADEAWMDVLKAKIRAHIEADGAHLDQFAKLIAETNKERWKHKMGMQKTLQDFKDKMSSFFCQKQ